MTPSERWRAVLNHTKPDRVPMDYWATDEVTKKLMEYLHCKDELDLWKRLHIDKAIGLEPKYIGPSERGLGSFRGGLGDMDIWGCRYRDIQYGTGSSAGAYRECIYHPLAEYKTVKEIEQGYEWPSVDWFDYSVVPDRVEHYREYPLMGGGWEDPLMYYKFLRGDKQAFIDLIRYPEITHYSLDKIFEFRYENTLRIYEQISPKSSGVVVLSYVSEDLGTQQGLMYSPVHIREFYLPRMKRMIDLVHKLGGFAFHHDDGAVREILPELVEAGIDLLNPVQWRCKGMERESLKHDFGDKIAFHGAMDNQYTLPFGSEAELRQEVRDNLRILGEDSGYILAPCHNLQPITPIKNITAMYDEGYKNGWYKDYQNKPKYRSLLEKEWSCWQNTFRTSNFT